MPTTAVTSTFQDLLLPVYLPTLLINICQGLIIPVLPLLLRSLHESDTIISLVFAFTGLGKAIADIPAGPLTVWLGDVNTMRLSLALYAVITVPVVLYPMSTPIILLVCAVWGGCLGVFAVGRTTLMTQLVKEKSHRGRASSMMGGMGRLAAAIGPLIGGFAAHYVSFRWALFMIVPIILLGLLSLGFVTQTPPVVVVAVEDEEEEQTTEMVPIASSSEVEREEEVTPQALPPTLLGELVKYRRFFITVGFFNFLMTIPRTSRKLILPLSGANAHMSTSEVGMLTSLSWCFDAGLFWTSGILMDKLGRKWSGVPSNLIMGLGFALLVVEATSLHHNEMLYISAVLMGVGNSMSSGLVNTLGMDFAPKDHPAVFLAIHRFLADAGIMVGPLFAGFLLDYTDYKGSCIGIALVSAACTLWLLLVVDVDPPKEEEEDDEEET